MSDGWGGGPASRVVADDQGVRPPLRFLVAAAISVGISAVLLLADNVVSNIIGYVAGTILTIGFVAVFRARDVEARTSTRYVHVPWANAAGVALIVVGLLVTVPHIWSLAVDWSKVD